MISHHKKKEQLKEEAQKARHAQAMLSLQRPQAMNSTLFTEPRRVQQDTDSPIISHINNVLGDYQAGVEEIGKRSGQIYDTEKNVRSSSRDVNNQQKYKVRPNGVNRAPNNNNVPSGRGQAAPGMHEESKMYQNSSTSSSSKESGHMRNSLEGSSHNRSSQGLRPPISSRQPSDKYGVEKDSSSSLSYQQKNKYGHTYPNLNHKSHSSSSISSSHNLPSSSGLGSSSSSSHNLPSSGGLGSSSSSSHSLPSSSGLGSSSSSHNLPSTSGLGSSSGVGGTKSSRPLSSQSADKSVHSSGSEKNYNDKHQSSSASDKHHSSNVNKTYSDLKVYSDKHHGDRGHPTSDGKAHSSSSERTMVHSSIKGQSVSPVSLPPPNLQPPCAAPQLSQSQRQGPPLLQPQQTQQQQLPPQLQHQQPPNIIPTTSTSTDIFDENHHSSPSISPPSINATNNIRMKPSQLTPQHTNKSSKHSSPHLPENLFNDEDNDIHRIVREMTIQPEILTEIKTPVKNYTSSRVKKKPEKDNVRSLGDKTSMPRLSLNQNPRFKNKSRPELLHLEISKNFHRSNADNLSQDDSDLTEDKVSKIIAEMTCIINSPISEILSPAKINSQPPSLKNINSDLADSDSEGSASDADERRPSTSSSSSDEDVNSIVKRLDISREKDAITEEVKNHMQMMLSPVVDGPSVSLIEPLRAQDDLSQDLEMSDSDNESIKSGSSPNSQHQPPPQIRNPGMKLRKGSSGFDIPNLQENDSDDEMGDVYKNPAADVHNSEVPTEITAPIDPMHFCGTPKLCAPTARKGSRESPHKNSDNEESDDDDDSDDDDEDVESTGPEELQEKVDQVSSSSTSSTESTESESDPSDVVEEPHLSPSPPSDPAKPATDGESSNSPGVIPKSPTLSWGLSRFITKPSESKPLTVTDPQSKSESDNCSSVANSNHSSPSNKDSSDESPSESANSDSDDEDPSHKSLPNASPNKSPALSYSEELPEDNGSLKRSSISSSAPDEITPAIKNEAFVGDTATKVAPMKISTSIFTTTTTTTPTTSSTTKLQEWPSVKPKKEKLSPDSTPMSVSPISSSVDKILKRKVSLPICISLSLLASSTTLSKKFKLLLEPSQPAENINTVKLEPVSCSQSPPEAAVDKKICHKQLLKREHSKFTLGYNSRLNRPIMVRIPLNMIGSLPINCKREPSSVKAEAPKSPPDLMSSSATNKPFAGSISGVSTLKSAPSKLISTTETTTTTTATTPPSLPPPLPTTTTTTTIAPPPPTAAAGASVTSSSSTASSSSTSTVTATSKMTLPHLAPPSTTSTASTLEKDFNFRIPKRNAESDPQDHRAKMLKADLQSSKSEAKTDPVKMDPSKKSDAAAANKSSALPPPDNLFASNKGNKLPKELKPQSTKYGRPCHDNNIDPTASAPVDENRDSMPNPNSVSNDKNAKENLSVPSTSLSLKSSSESLKDMTKAATASSSTSASSSSVVEPSSTSKLSLSSSGASSAANIADPRLTPSTTTSSNLNANSNSSSAGDCSSSSSNNSSSKRSSDNIRSGRPLVKVQTTTSSSSSSSSSKHKNNVNSYFQEATKMKHEGNKKTDVFEKAYLYMQSVVFYVQCGVEMEKSRKHQECQKMLSETLELLGQIGHYHQYRQEQKLSVLRLLLMSVICKKLYDLKKKVAENLRQALDEHYKQYLSSTCASATAHSHTPSPVRPNLNISTPSSRSTPSPSGSIDSIRSQGSSTSDARLTPSTTSANTTTSSSSTTTNTTSSSSTIPSSSINPHSSSVTNASTSSSQTVVIPKRIHSITRNYMDIMDYLAKAHQYSDQAAIQRDNCKDFMELLNSRCKTISVQSSISEHIDYVKAGLQILQDS